MDKKRQLKNKKDVYLGEQKIWIEQRTINEILNNISTQIPINVNIFKKNPLLTSYTCYDPIKIRIEVYKLKENKNVT